MCKWLRTVCVAVPSVLAMAGCASITQGSSQTVLVTTPGATGAKCTLTSPEIGTQVVNTPGSVSLPKSKHDVRVSCEKDGYKRGEGVLTSTVEGWTFGNVLIGGLIGLAVDASSGAMNKYAGSVAIPMVKDDELTPAPPTVPQQQPKSNPNS